MDKAFDVIVAGGGIAGLLAAARLAATNPDRRIVLLEKEPVLGGRLRATSPETRLYSYGLNAISGQLFDLWNQILKTDPDAEDLAALVGGRQAKVGVLAGNKMTEADIAEWFKPKGARTLGGLTAARQWPEVEAIVNRMADERPGASRAAAADGEDAKESEDGDDAVEESDGKSHAFAHYWKKPRKVPAAVVLEHFGSAIGIPDVWNATASAIAERAAYHSGRLHCGAWGDAIQALRERPWFKERVTVVTGSRIVDAAHEDGVWVVDAEDGTYRAPSLVIAQPPWQAIIWLKRIHWPAQILQVTSKTKPVSVVCLAEQVLLPDVALPDVVIVPSEHVQIVRTGPTDICFQATIDYEMSLQAPIVVKSVKALKRARRKLLALYPGLVSEGNHLALQPIAWAQSPAQSDRRWLERMAKKPVGTKSLSFIGDAYGASYDGDANLVSSLTAAVEALDA